jgi:hypothetical protein
VSQDNIDVVFPSADYGPSEDSAGEVAIRSAAAFTARVKALGFLQRIK